MTGPTPNPSQAPSPTAPTPRLVLASQSPRRRELLARAGFTFAVRPPRMEDADLHPGEMHTGAWAAALGYVKASAVAREMADHGEPREGVVILGSDTIVVLDGTLIGKAAHEAEARAMIRAMRERDHEVVTGVAVINADTGDRRILFDTAHVHVGAISDGEIDRYVVSGQWRGKAGAYNLFERQAAGWPIRVTGDETAVVGLPMGKVVPLLASLGIRPGGGAA